MINIFLRQNIFINFNNTVINESSNNKYSIKRIAIIFTALLIFWFLKKSGSTEFKIDQKSDKSIVEAEVLFPPKEEITPHKEVSTPLKETRSSRRTQKRKKKKK